MNSLLAAFILLTLPAKQEPFAAALFPLPPALRADATIVRLDSASVPEVIRQGTNGIVCIEVRPRDETFDVRCYREAMIPIIYRSFQLGYNVAGPKVGDEIRSGKLKLGNEPTAGYRCLGPAAGYDAIRNSIDDRIDCWQSLHFPFRTAAEVGFPDMADVPESQRRTMPYVMGSGTYWSHVMIQHPRQR
jgi:hypothetical protein